MTGVAIAERIQSVLFGSLTDDALAILEDRAARGTLSLPVRSPAR